MTGLRPNQWLGVLVKLAAPLDPVKAAEGALGMEPALALLPGYKLTQESAIYVASKSKRMPNYGTICELLDEWWRDNKPPSSLAALPAPDTSPHAELEKREEANRQSWEAPERVRRSVASVRSLGDRNPMYEVCGKFLGKAVWKYAPHNLGLVPPEWHPSNGSNNTERHK